MKNLFDKETKKRFVLNLDSIMQKAKVKLLKQKFNIGEK